MKKPLKRSVRTTTSKIIPNNNIDEALQILDNVSSFPTKEDQSKMTPEQRKVIDEVMRKAWTKILKERTIQSGCENNAP